MYKFIKTAKENAGKGYINHDDLEREDLTFLGVVESGSHVYNVVKGETAKQIDAWVERTKSTQVTRRAFMDEVKELIPVMSVCDMGHKHDNDDWKATKKMINEFTTDEEEVKEEVISIKT